MVMKLKRVRSKETQLRKDIKARRFLLKSKNPIAIIASFDIGRKKLRSRLKRDKRALKRIRAKKKKKRK